MKLATWNVNSIRQRCGHVTRWLQQHTPDVLVLQETKCEAHAFPHEAFTPLGYRSEAVGQKAYNGVAVVARVPFEVTCRALDALPQEDAQARYIEVATEGMHVGGLYLPNGNSGGDVGYAYKLAWMEALRARAVRLLDNETPFALLGDFNVCPQDDDFAPGSLPASDALVRPETRARFRALLWLGLTDAVRALHPTGPVYTFWDYQAGAWQRDLGLRIDHALLSPELADRLIETQADREERAQPQPSDHVPLVVSLAPI